MNNSVCRRILMNLTPEERFEIVVEQGLLLARKLEDKGWFEFIEKAWAMGLRPKPRKRRVSRRQQYLQWVAKGRIINDGKERVSLG